jgi:hypothetical protein
MVFSPTRYEEVPNVDLLSWTFGGLEYDEDKDVRLSLLPLTSNSPLHAIYLKTPLRYTSMPLTILDVLPFAKHEVLSGN